MESIRRENARNVRSALSINFDAFRLFFLYRVSINEVSFYAKWKKSKEHKSGLFHKKKSTLKVFTNKKNEINVLLQG